MVLSFYEGIKELMPKIGGISPDRNILKCGYSPSEDDAVTFTYSDNPEELFKSIKVKPYPNLKFKKSVEHFLWSGYAEDEKNQGTTSELEIIYKDNDIYSRQALFGDVEVNSIHFDSDKKIKYRVRKKVSDTEFDDKGNPITKEYYFITDYNRIKEGMIKINPFKLYSDESLYYAAIVKYNDKPVIYLEILKNNNIGRFIKEWIDIKTGISLRTETFNPNASLNEVFVLDELNYGDFEPDYKDIFEDKEYTDITIYDEYYEE